MLNRLFRASESYGWLLAIAAVLIFALSYFVLAPASGPAIETVGLAKDEQPIPEDLADHQTRGDMERGRSVGAAPSTAIARYSSAQFIESPNWSGRGTCGVEGVVLHVTGPGSLGGMDSWFKNPTAQVSAHFGIGKDGSVHQYVQVGDAAWHAGIINKPDLANPLIAGYVSQGINPNRCTVGIELLLAGPGEPLSDYPAMQESLATLLLWLHLETGVSLDRVHVVGHYQIDSINRSTDPVCCVSIDNVLKGLNTAPVRAYFPDGWSYDSLTGDWYNPAGEKEWSACNSDRLRFNFIVQRWFAENTSGGFDPLPTRGYWSWAGAC